jgi:hypothetical protein
MLSQPNENGFCWKSKRPGKSIPEMVFSVKKNGLHNFVLENAQKTLLASHAGSPY